MGRPPGEWADDWFSVPLYPAPPPKVVRVGDCVRGWVLFEIPKGKHPTRMEYNPVNDFMTSP
ncbi:DUF4352 domain-containing protein [Actinomadura harenae]|uniref:DUF4352 domain-containing protein n=1 Tax=Actinomadura harenae TaxID=2483351 RepID=UPI0011C49CFC|nr:DUF4352 domain-containing protein [Actinomadura harenae]